MQIAMDSGKRRQFILGGIAVVLLIVAGVVAVRNLGDGGGYKIAAERAFMCAECGHVFEHTIQLGDKEPLECPKCGKQAAWVPERCYWTKGASGEWKAKAEPTFVLLKERMGIDEKTYCPDCGRQVVGHNPKPPPELMEAAEAGK